MGFFDVFALQDGGREAAGERVAGANRVGHFHLRCLNETYFLGREDVTAIHATGEYEHFQVVLAQDEPALVLHIKTGIAKEATDRNEFLVVDFQNIAGIE